MHAFRGVVPNEKRFLGGESIGELFDRVLPALERLLADETWDTVLLVLHGAVNRAIFSYALTGQRMFLGHFEQSAGCVNVLDVGDEWIVRAVNVSPTDPAHRLTRKTTMERYWEHYRREPRRGLPARNRRGAPCLVGRHPATSYADLGARRYVPAVAHFVAETGWNVPFVYFTIRSHLIGN